MTVFDTRTLDGFSRMIGCSSGVSVSALEAGTIVGIRTQRSRYRLLLLDEPNQVLIAGGRLFPEPVEARIVGATGTGTMVKAGAIVIGLRLEIRVGSQRFTISPVQSIAIDGVETHAIARERTDEASAAPDTRRENASANARSAGQSVYS
jgi:hypothetical protein